MDRVLVGIPTYDERTFCRDQLFKGLATMSGVDEFCIVTNSGEADARDLRERANQLHTPVTVVVTKGCGNGSDQVVINRNALRKYFLDNTFTWFLSMDDDIVTPTNVVEVLHSHTMPVVSGWYLNPYSQDGTKHIVPVIFIESTRPDGAKGVRAAFPEEITKPALLKVAGAGLGCTLIKRDVLEQIEFSRNKEGSEDIMFNSRVRKELGIQPLVDTRVTCLHYKKNKGRVGYLDARQYQADAKQT